MITTALVAAEDAPVGVLLWPVTHPAAEPNRTLADVSVVSRPTGDVVVWRFQSGLTRTFNLGEDVVVAASAVAP
jgi:hypothetical protein